ncbi:GumC family protein [Thermovibrio sp.]
MNKRQQEREEYLYYDDDEIDLYELWLTLKRRKKIVFGTTFLFLLVAVILCFILPPVYRTKTTLMPLGGTQAEGLSSLLSSLPISLPISNSKSGITVQAVLESRTLKERIIKDLNLLPKLFPKQWDKRNNRWVSGESHPTILDGVKKLEGLMSVSTDKETGVIELTVDFKRDPKTAYDIAKTAIKETENILNEKSFTVAKRYRIYVEKQLAIAREKLAKLEKVYKEFMEGKIKKVPFIFGGDIREYGRLQGELSLKEKKLEFLKNTDGYSPEEVARLKSEIKKLKQKIHNFQGKVNFVSLPTYQLNLQNLQMQMEIAQGLLEALVKEYELAKAQEMKEQISFQVIDPPYIPDKDKPYKPKKLLIITVALISGLFLGIFAAFFKEWLDNVKKAHKEERDA